LSYFIEKLQPNNPEIPEDVKVLTKKNLECIKKLSGDYDETIGKIISETEDYYDQSIQVFAGFIQHAKMRTLQSLSTVSDPIKNSINYLKDELEKSTKTFNQRPEELIDDLIKVVQGGKKGNYDDVLCITNKILNNSEFCKENLKVLDEHVHNYSSNYSYEKLSCLENFYNMIENNYGQESQMMQHIADQFVNSKSMINIKQLNTFFIQEAKQVLGIDTKKIVHQNTMDNSKGVFRDNTQSLNHSNQNIIQNNTKNSHNQQISTIKQMRGLLNQSEVSTKKS